MAPEYLQPSFISRNDITSYQLRNSAYKLAAPQPQIRYLKESVSFRGAMLWNSHLQDL